MTHFGSQPDKANTWGIAPCLQFLTPILILIPPTISYAMLAICGLKPGKDLWLIKGGPRPLKDRTMREEEYRLAEGKHPVVPDDESYDL